MKMTLKPTTHLAFQATLSVAFILFVAHILHLEKPYWGVISAVFLTAQTFGESVNKSFSRIAMTILGGVVGTALYFVLAGHFYLIMAAVLVSVFFISFYLSVSYGLSVFFTTILVVFLFAGLKNWTLDTLWIRVYETIFGAVMAMLASAFILPIRTQTVLKNNMITFMESTRDAIAEGFSCLLENKPLSADYKKRQFMQWNQLRLQIQNLRYDTLFQVTPNLHIQDLLSEGQLLYSFSGEFLEMLSEGLSPVALKIVHDQLGPLRDSFAHNFAYVIQEIQGQKPEGEFLQIMQYKMDLRAKALASLQAKQSENKDWLNCFPAIHILERVNHTLSDMVTLLEK